MIHWEHPHSPKSMWVLEKSLQPTISDNDLQIEIDEILNNKEYFEKCSSCHKVVFKGFMIEIENWICH